MPDTMKDQPWLDLCIEVVHCCLERVQAVSRTPTRGTEFVNSHADPTMRIDRELERAVLGVLKRRKVAATVISEELVKLGDVPVLRPSGDAYARGERVYLCVDPLDGSKVYQRNIRAFWYSCVGVYSEEGKALAGAVLDLNTRHLFFCDGERAYEGVLRRNGQVRGTRVLKPSPATTLDGCYLETYLMLPRVYLPLQARLTPLIRRSGFVIPNGGPASFCDVAAGVADVYVELASFPLTEVFSGGLMIAAAAGCITTDLQGKEVRFDPDVAKGYSLVCAATEDLHAAALELLRAT